jgi:uncharacterized protein
MGPHRDAPHLPRLAAIDSYGNGGFRFADMSHRGSLLCLPSGIWAWPVARVSDLNEDAFAPVFAEADAIDFFLLGTGRDFWVMPEPLRWRFRERAVGLEVTQTGTAIRTFNIVLAEGRRVAAGLLAVA